MAKKEKKETFEEALARLEAIADRLEHGDMPLEDSLREYEDGVKAYRYCAELLGEVEKKIEVLTRDSKGRLAAREADELTPEE